MKVLKWIGIIILFLALAFVTIGLVVPNTYNGVSVRHYDAPVSDLWKVVTDVEALPEMNHAVISVEILEEDSLGPKKWRENYDMNEGYGIFERSDYLKYERYQVKMLESTFGMSGKWTFELQRRGDHSGLTIYEDRTIDNWLIKSTFLISGNEAIMEQQFDAFKDALGE